MANENSHPEEMVTIRMKPGRGRMKLGCKWILGDGKETEIRPRNMGEVIDTVDTYLEARTKLDDGSFGPGPTATLPLSKLRGMLGKDGQPSRKINGYHMQKHGESTEEIPGTTKQRTIRENYSPSYLSEEFEDATFEIVKTASQKAA